MPIRLAPGVGNQLFQLVFANHLSNQFSHSTLIHFGIPEIGIRPHPEHSKYLKIIPDFKLTNVEERYSLSLKGRGYSSRAVIHVSALGMNKDMILQSNSFLESLLPAVSSRAKDTFLRFQLKDKVLCHIRGSDIWRGFPMSGQTRTLKHLLLRTRTPVHPNYSALPLDFYAKIRQNTKKDLVFLIEKSSPWWYQKLIIKRFGKEAVLFSDTARHDFDLIRLCKDIALSISTFSWMAAFLGESRRIHFPIRGLFDPAERPDLELEIPNKELARYHFSNHAWAGTLKDLHWIREGRAFHVK